MNKKPKTYRAMTTFLALAGLSTLAGAQTQALTDFGNQSAFELASTIAGPASNSGVPDIGNPTTATPPTYNNISYGGTAYRAKADFWDTGTQQGLLGLVDTAGAATGWSIELEVTDAKAGDDYSGVYVGDAPSVIKDNYAQTAWEDLLFLQSGGLVTVSITGLDDSKTFDLLFYGSRSAGGTQTWSLTKGTGGSNVVHGTRNNTSTVVDWTGISTDGSGEIEFTIAASGGDAALNFGSITERGDTSDYDTWATSYPGADLTDPNGDFDADGLTNNGERLWGLDPTSGSSVNPFTSPLDATLGTLTYTRRNPALTGATYSYQWSATLEAESWAPFTPASEAATGASPVESVTITLDAGLLANPKLFVRVLATEN